MKTFEYVKYKVDFRYIVAAVKKSFPTDDESDNEQIRKILKVCNDVDNYFNESRRKKYILALDEAQRSDIVKLKYDKNNLYMRADIINEILRIVEFPGNFSVDIKKMLTGENLITSYFKNDGKREYSVHLPNSKNRSDKTQAHYIAFSRANCREEDLFLEFENYIYEIELNKLSNSCQKD